MIQEISKTALVGTSKHASAGNVDPQHPAEALLTDVAAEDREHTFLLRAGVRALFEHCGRMPRSGVAQPPPCPAETRAFAPHKAIGPIQNAIASDSRDLLREFLIQLNAAQLLLPAELLPQALGFAEQDIRENLLPVIGERGRWLSGFNPDWRWVTDGVEQLSGQDRDAITRQWNEGAINERARALRTLRRSDPAAAREWFEAVMDSEKADNVVRLLSAFEISLSPADEATLESRLDGRSEHVRRIAASLLARLPSSALAARMRERAETMLVSKSAGLIRKKLKLICQPPESIDKSWERDGVPKKVAGRGQRAVWTETILSAVPPSHWSKKFNVEPSQLIEAIREDDFSQPVLTAWTEAAAVFAESDADSAGWLRPLWDYWLEQATRPRATQTAPQRDHLQLLLRSMPSPEAAVEPILQASTKDIHPQLSVFLTVLPRPWSESFGRSYLRALRKVIGRQVDDRVYAWVTTLHTASCALPPATFSEALEICDSNNADAGNWYSQAMQRETEKFREIIHTRAEFYEYVTKR